MEYFLKCCWPFYWPGPQRTSEERYDVDDENRIAIEGFLYKRAGNTMKTWQRSWFQVYENQLVYLKRSKPRVVMEDLQLCTIHHFRTVRHRYCLKVVSPTKSYMLAADSEGTRLAWTRAIEKIALVSQHRPENSEHWSHQEEPPAPGAPDLKNKRTGTPIANSSSSPSNEFFLSKYTIGKELGKGGYGSVSAGVCKADSRQVAIKYVYKHNSLKYMTIPGEAESLPAEVALMLMVSRSPRCNNIIELLEWYDHPKYYILILEKPSLCMDLATYIKEGPLSEGVAQIIMAQVVLAVCHCSTQGVLHNDIKTENILVNPNDLKIKLIDFGCGDLLQTAPYRAFEGTWINIPPEWITYYHYYGCPATVWSLGILHYEILCGDLPFKTIDQIREGVLHFTRDLSAACCHLIRNCLAKEPDNRLNLSEILDHEWFGFQE